MALTADEVVVELKARQAAYRRQIEGSAQTFERSMGRIQRAGATTERQTDTSFRKMSLGAALFARASVAALGVAAVSFGNYAARASRDAEELDSAIAYTFGRNTEAVRDWADETGDALGRTSTELKQAALDFQTLFGPAAGADAGAEMSKQFAVLVQDLSSFRNVAADIVRQNLVSGLVGETEPLRRYGIIINEAKVKTKALEMGLVAAGEEVSDYGKILARAELIVAATAKAQGDLARTSDSSTNRLRKAKTATSELAEETGKFLNPALASMADWWSQITENITTALERFREWRDNTKEGGGLFVSSTEAGRRARAIAGRIEGAREARPTIFDGTLRQLRGAFNAYADFIDPPEKRTAPTEAPDVDLDEAPDSFVLDKPDKKTGGKTAAEKAADLAERQRERYDNALAQAQDAELAAMFEIAKGAEERARLELLRLENQSKARDAELAHAVQQEELTAEQAKTIRAAEKRAEAAEATAVLARRDEELTRELLEQHAYVDRIYSEIARIHASRATTARATLDIELRDLQHRQRIEREQLEADIARDGLSESAANERRGALGDLHAAQREALESDAVDRLKRPILEAFEAIENGSFAEHIGQRIKAAMLENLAEQLARIFLSLPMPGGAGGGSGSGGGWLGKALTIGASLIFGGPTAAISTATAMAASGIGGSGGSIFGPGYSLSSGGGDTDQTINWGRYGRWAGGNVVGGVAYPVNEKGHLEAFVAPQSGKIVPLGDVKAQRRSDSGGGSRQVTMALTIDLKGANGDETIERIARRAAATGAAQAFQAAMDATPGRVEQYQRLGT